MEAFILGLIGEVPPAVGFADKLWGFPTGPMLGGNLVIVMGTYSAPVVQSILNF